MTHDYAWWYYGCGSNLVVRMSNWHKLHEAQPLNVAACRRCQPSSKILDIILVKKWEIQVKMYTSLLAKVLLIAIHFGGV